MAKVKIRKKEEVLERRKAKEEEALEQEKPIEDQEWVKHWEKEQDPSKPKKKGGGKRPRPFKSN